jgi:hypothetical protein
MRICRSERFQNLPASAGIRLDLIFWLQNWLYEVDRKAVGVVRFDDGQGGVVEMRFTGSER